MPTNATQISIFSVGRTPVPGRQLAFSTGGMRGTLCEGRSSITRCAIPPASACVHRLPGKRTISAASLCVAQSLGSSDSSAASFQGSRFSRASADRTLSGISFLSTPIDAWRKSSSSGLKMEVEAAGVTMTTNGADVWRGAGGRSPCFVRQAAKLVSATAPAVQKAAQTPARRPGHSSWGNSTPPAVADLVQPAT